MGSCNEVVNAKEEFNEKLFKYDIPWKQNLPRYYRFLRPIYFQSKHLTALKGEVTKSQVPVVIKKLSKADFSRVNFKAEMFILLQLDHPNINHCLEYFQTKNHYFIIYPYFTGLPLIDYFLEKSEDMNEIFLRRVMVNLLTGLNYIHEKNICHRNLDPKKIIFDGKTLLISGLNKARVLKKKQLFRERIIQKDFRSPETILGGYNEKADIWVVGIIFHIIITGIHPFLEKDENDTEENILNKKFKTDLLKKSKISKESIEVIVNMLNKDPTKRSSAGELLKMKWFSQNFKEPGKLPNVRKSIMEFQQRNKFIDHFKKFYVEQILTMDEKAELAEAFKEFDLDNNGVLTFDEFKLAINNTFVCMNEDEIKILFNEIDTNRNGLIEYTEFITGLMGRKDILQKEKIDNFFDLCHTDKNDKLHFDEFRKIVGKNKYFDDMFVKYGGKDKVLSKTEFTKIILKAVKDIKQ